MILAEAQVDASSGTPQALRARMNAALEKLAAEPEPVGRIENRSVPGPVGTLPARFYWPREDAAGLLPVCLSFHSGGYVVYDLESVDAQCRILTNRTPCIVISIDYRLAPEAKFPAPVEDCRAAAEWTAGHAHTFGGDPSRMALAGEICGGTMASVVSMLARDAGGPPIALVAMVCPLAEMIDPPPTTEIGRLARWFRRLYLNNDSEAADFRASPLLATDFAGLPPTLIVTGEHDPLCGQGEAYAAKLRTAGVAVEYACFDGMIHNFTSMGGALDGAEAALDRIAAALRRAFGTTRSGLPA